MNRVVILDSGVANLASVISAFRDLGWETSIARRPEDLVGATHLVLPGVGAFGPAMRSLAERGLDRALRRAVEEGVPLLAVCLGLQLLCEGSDEAPGVDGLGVIPQRVADERFQLLL